MRQVTARKALLAGGTLVVVWLVLAGVQVFGAYRSATSGLDEMEGLGALATDDLGSFIDSMGGDTDDVPEETAAAQLASAATDFSAAKAHLGSVFLAPLRPLPVIGRQLRSAQALATSAETTANAGSVAFDQLNAELAGTAQSPGARLETASTTQRVLEELQAALSGLDAGPAEKLLPPLARARNRFTAEYDRTMETLDSALVTVRGVNEFLTGPTRYLVLASNNAEMRAGSGMFLQVGQLTVTQGVFEVSEFTPAGQLLANLPSTDLDPDIARLWDWLDPDREWRNLNLSPRFDQSARMAADMWVAAGNEPVDGVMSLDVVGVAELLDTIGPVEVGEGPERVEVSSRTVIDYLLLEQYEDFVDDRDARRDQLGTVSRAIFEAFNNRSWSASGLMQSLKRSGEGRHVMLWSTNETEQAAWTELGATGVPRADSLMVSVLNRGGNKLDQFLEVDAELTAEPADGSQDMRRLTLNLTLSNTAPEHLPPYVEGPHPLTGLSAGDYLGLVSVSLPGGAGNLSMDGARLMLSGDDGPSRMAIGEVLIPRGQSADIQVSFDLPTDWEEIEITPSARVPAVTWDRGGVGWGDGAPVQVNLDDL
ncbi:MAG: DUF4012 domain-containing protein [Microthrixaceae bacterium]